MSQKDDRYRRHVDALEAMAAGKEAPPAPTGRQEEAPPGTSSGLLLLSEDQAAGASAAEALGELADLTAAPGSGQDEAPQVPEDVLMAEPAAAAPADQAAEGPADRPLDDLAAASPGAPPVGEALSEIAALSAPSTLAARQARLTQMETRSRRVYAHQYKRTLIPLLLAVGALLFIFSGVTLAMLLRGNPDLAPGETTYLLAYGRYFVMAALPLGAILLAGAWLFHVETRGARKG